MEFCFSFSSLVFLWDNSVDILLRFNVAKCSTKAKLYSLFTAALAEGLPIIVNHEE